MTEYNTVEDWVEHEGWARLVCRIAAGLKDQDDKECPEDCRRIVLSVLKDFYIWAYDEGVAGQDED